MINDRDLEHPVITNLCRTGYPDGIEPQEPRCPECGEVCETIYLRNGEAVGCEICVRAVEAWTFTEDSFDQ